MGCRCMGEGRTVPEIHLEQVSKYYRQEKKLIPAVEQINLVVAQGEFVFVTGSSGAGKSTLLQLIAGVISPSRGRIYFSSGQSGGGVRRWRARRADELGYVPQLSQLLRRQTVMENLTLAAQCSRRWRKAPARERVQKALRMVGMGDAAEKYPVQLSLGECRKVELARAIVNSPSILVLDELTASLDEDTIWDLFHLIDEINRLGTTVIMATHAKQFVNLMRKRVITLVDGRVLGDVQKGRYGDIV